MNGVINENNKSVKMCSGFASHELCDGKKCSLYKNLKFSVKLGYIQYSEFLLPLLQLFQYENMKVLECGFYSVILDNFY